MIRHLQSCDVFKYYCIIAMETLKMRERKMQGWEMQGVENAGGGKCEKIKSLERRQFLKESCVQGVPKIANSSRTTVLQCQSRVAFGKNFRKKFCTFFYNFYSFPYLLGLAFSAPTFWCRIFQFCILVAPLL